MEDLSVVIPSYNEEHIILATLKRELESLGAEVIIVEDGSATPYTEAIKHGVNFGYGGALMTGIRNATRPLIATCDGDGQHQVSEVVKLYHAFKLMEDADMVVGMRRLQHEKLHRVIGRKLLNWTASLICNRWLSDLNSGARIFRRDIVLNYFPILCRQFSFTTSLTISMLCDNHRVEFFPIKVADRAHGKSRVRLVKHGLITLFYILRNGLALRTRNIRKFIRGLRGNHS